jgi:formylglycine-generating enzyme required for sulfatase activity
LWVVALLGCEGERVESARTDAAVADVAVIDSAPAETAMGGECGEHAGAKMVRVGSFCIDTTEVTRGQFLAFLAAPLDKRDAARPPECAWNTTDPTINATASGDPVGEVNFCDALAYCAWAGKRLCGRIGGGPHSPDDYADAMKSEWFAVCSVNGAQTFPYVGGYSKAKCFTEEGTAGATGTRTTCAGGAKPYSEVFDLVGNVFEWENACTGSPSGEKSTRCRTRGGSYGNGATATCAMDDLTTVNTRLPGIGFRCCKD